MDRKPGYAHPLGRALTTSLKLTVQHESWAKGRVKAQDQWSHWVVFLAVALYSLVSAARHGSYVCLCVWSLRSAWF